MLQRGENIAIVLRVILLLFLASVLSELIRLRRYNVEWHQSGLDRSTFWHLSSFQQFWQRITNRISKTGYLDDHSVSLLLDDLEPLTTLMPVVHEPVLHLDRMLVTQCDSTEVVGDLRLPRTIPLIICHPLGIGDPRSLLSAFSPDASFATHMALFVVVGKPTEFNWHTFITKFRGAFARELILLTSHDLENLIKAETPTKYLRRRILHQISLTTVSPFTVTGPASDDMFFGREAELRDILENVEVSSYVVIGGRRIGKTSTLGRLHRVRLPAAGFRTLYHDCSTTPAYDVFLATAIRDWRPDPPADVPATFGDLLQSPPSDKPLVLILDEADKLVPADRANNWRLFNALRALANSGRAQVVLSGERTLRDALRDPKSPLFNFANEMLLGPLDYRAVEELVTRPMKQLEIELVDEKVIVDRIWAFTSGHPNVVQRLCRRLIERLNELGTRRITLDDVDAVIEDPGFQRDDFLSTYWEAATSLEKIISLLMADDESVRTLRAVRRALAERCNLRPKAREVDDALQRLVDLRSILKRTPTGYEFAVEAFPRVVAGTMTLEDMLEVLVEDYAEEQAKGET